MGLSTGEARGTHWYRQTTHFLEQCPCSPPTFSLLSGWFIKHTALDFVFGGPSWWEINSL